MSPKLMTKRPTQLGLYWVRFPAIPDPFYHNWRAAIIDRLRGEDVTYIVDFPACMWNLNDPRWNGAEWFGPLPGPDDPWPTAHRNTNREDDSDVDD